MTSSTWMLCILKITRKRDMLCVAKVSKKDTNKYPFENEGIKYISRARTNTNTRDKTNRIINCLVFVFRLLVHRAKPTVYENRQNKIRRLPYRTQYTYLHLCIHLPWWMTVVLRLLLLRVVRSQLYKFVFGFGASKRVRRYGSQFNSICYQIV